MTLNEIQLQILKVLYTYRYGTRPLLAASLGVRNSAVLHQKLEVLIKHGYVGKHHKKEYYLQHKPAVYHLLPNGYRALKEIPYLRITEAMVKAAYRDNTRSSSFIEKYLFIYSSLTALSRRYPYVKQFTARELLDYTAFPHNLPDAYLSYWSGADRLHFFLNAIPDGTPKPTIEDIVSDYHKFFHQDTWLQTGSALPALLIITESTKSQSKLIRLIREKTKALSMTGPSIYITTLPVLQQTSSNDVVTQT